MRQKKQIEPPVGDRIARAYERERDHKQVPRWPIECETTFAHVFRCECCGRQRREEDRREPRSWVCVRCVEAAGFDC